MESTPSCGASSRPAVRTIQKRRIWSKREEEVLILALKEIIQEGWKCENGFRVGYLHQLEKIMRRHFPQTDLRSEPHIGNKIHIWKKNHGSIQCMLSRSVFSWDSKTNTVVFEHESIWDDYVKTDNHVKGMKNKSYPLYNVWCEVFGMDRATGEYAEDLHDADMHQLDDGYEQVNQNNGVDNDLSGENDITSSMQQSGRSSGKTRKRKRGIVNCGAGEQLVELMGKFCEQTNANLQAIASRIGYEKDMSEKRVRLFEALGELGVLNADQQICAAKIMAKDKADLDLFFSLPNEARARMVVMMVTGRI